MQGILLTGIRPMMINNICSTAQDSIEALSNGDSFSPEINGLAHDQHCV